MTQYPHDRQGHACKVSESITNKYRRRIPVQEIINKLVTEFAIATTYSICNIQMDPSKPAVKVDVFRRVIPDLPVKGKKSKGCPY